MTLTNLYRHCFDEDELGDEYYVRDVSDGPMQSSPVMLVPTELSERCAEDLPATIKLWLGEGRAAFHDLDF